MKESNELVKRIPPRGDSDRSLPSLPLPVVDIQEPELIDSPEAMRLRSYLEILRKNVWLIVGITALSTVVTAVYMARKPDVYGAVVRVQIDLESNPAMGVNGKPIVINDSASAPNYFATQLEILKGPGLLRRVVKTLDLEHNRAFMIPESGQRSTWQRLKGMVGLGSDPEYQPVTQNEEVLLNAAVAPATDRENLAEIKRLTPYVGIIQSGLVIEQIGPTRLVQISFMHRDPQIAAKVVNAIADTYVLSNLERMTETNTGAATFLKKRIADLQAQIRNGEERLINYAKENQIISLDASQNTVVDRLSGLNRQLMEAENERKLAEAAYRSALEPGAAGVLAGAGSTAETESKLNDLRRQLAELRTEYTDKWPAIRTLKEQIAELEKQLDQSQTRSADMVLKSLELKLRQAQQGEQAIRAAFERQRNETIAQNNAAINYRIIQQEIQTNQELLNGLLQRYRENDVILAGTPNNIRVVDYANTPDSPIGPQRTRGVALAFVFSLGLGVGLSILREMANNTLRTSGDIEQKVRLPAIAVVPTFKGEPDGRFLPTPRSLFRGRNGYRRNGRPLVIYSDVRSPLAEIYRKLRTTVLLAGDTPKSLLVTSSLPAEGKTTTAVNMAGILAQTGAKVLLVDADMRRPTLHQIFSLDNRTGLSTLLTEKVDEESFLLTIRHDGETGLCILPSGPIPLKPAELLSSQEMRRLLEVAASTFTHIIIDSPPVISFTDSVLISSLVDGVILVVQGGKSSHEVVKHCRDELQEVGANIFGVVLNNVEVQPHDSYYYYYSSPYSSPR